MGLAGCVALALALLALLGPWRGAPDPDPVTSVAARPAPALDPAPESPDKVFTGVRSVEFQLHGRDVLQRRHVEPDALAPIARCLEATVEVGPEAAESRPLLQTTFLVLVRDDHGMHDFEMLTDQHLKGNGERYYVNRCIHAFVDA